MDQDQVELKQEQGVDPTKIKVSATSVKDEKPLEDIDDSDEVSGASDGDDDSGDDDDGGDENE